MSREPPPDLVVLDREYDGTASTLRSARHDVVRALSAHQPDKDLQARAELVVSELATNAIQASPDVPYGVRVSLAGDGSVVVAITSSLHDDGLPPRSAWRPTHPAAPRGRGLLIVTELTDEVEVERPVDGTVVVIATLRAAGAG
jgi:anti-sigma regulatory factor (Ser/Thr protein kinase)